MTFKKVAILCGLLIIGPAVLASMSKPPALTASQQETKQSSQRGALSDARAEDATKSSDRVSIPTVSGEDLFVDLRKYAGKEIRVSMRVTSANNRGGIGYVGSVTVNIDPRGFDLETWRILLRDCNHSNPACNDLRMIVTPTGRTVISNWPELINVHFDR